jgi:hypothetical protein
MDEFDPWVPPRGTRLPWKYREPGERRLGDNWLLITAAIAIAGWALVIGIIWAIHRVLQ